MKLFRSLVAFIILGGGSAFVQSQEWNLDLGKETYELQCARCHGVKGDGQGMDAKRVPVWPRNFIRGEFKYRTTSSGNPPRDEDILWIIDHGLSGTGMPTFSNLPKDVKMNLIAYVKSFSDVFEETEIDAVTAPNSKLKANLSRGKEMYDLVQCQLCHGQAGRSNGSSSFTLEDSQNRPIRPVNLTQGWTYRRGNRAEDIYYRMMSGINGTPMFSIEGAIPEEDVWHLANYVKSIQLEANFDIRVQASQVWGDLPQGLDDGAWKEARRTDVNMQGQYYSQGRKQQLPINAVSIQALYNDKDIAFRLFWNDPIKDEGQRSDAILIALRPGDQTGVFRDNLHTLDKFESAALDLYKWSANKAALVGRQKANLVQASQPGFRPAETFEATASYEDGLWTLSFKRPLNLSSEGAVSLEGQSAYLSFAAWDGALKAHESNPSLSKWIALELGKGSQRH